MEYLSQVFHAVGLKYATMEFLGSPNSSALWHLVEDVLLLCHNEFQSSEFRQAAPGLVPLMAAALQYPRARSLDGDAPAHELLVFLCFVCDECGLFEHYRHHCTIPTPPYPATRPVVVSNPPPEGGSPSSDRCIQLYTQYRRARQRCARREKEQRLWEKRWSEAVPALTPYEALVVSQSSVFNAHRSAMREPGEADVWTWAAELLDGLDGEATSDEVHDVESLQVANPYPAWAEPVYEQREHVRHLWAVSRARLDADGKMHVRKACSSEAQRLERLLIPLVRAGGVSREEIARHLTGKEDAAWAEAWSALVETCGPLHIVRKPSFLNNRAKASDELRQVSRAAAQSEVVPRRCAK